MSANDNPQPPRYKRSGSNKRQRSAGILVKLTPADHQRVKAEAAAVGMSACARADCRHAICKGALVRRCDTIDAG